mmetsp:Transcript_24682/g.79949  ORF Transcript_24682/g.79949 Transcript_24682/m.79949 type:complete len:205 (-) Transcript_24682:14-628(-)
MPGGGRKRDTRRRAPRASGAWHLARPSSPTPPSCAVGRRRCGANPGARRGGAGGGWSAWLAEKLCGNVRKSWQLHTIRRQLLRGTCWRCEQLRVGPAGLPGRCTASRRAHKLPAVYRACGRQAAISASAPATSRRPPARRGACGAPCGWPRSRGPPRRTCASSGRAGCGPPKRGCSSPSTSPTSQLRTWPTSHGSSSTACTTSR